MKLHIHNFINLLKKCTVNNCMDYTQLRFENGKITCNIINAEQNIICKLCVDNDVILDLKEDIELNIISPDINVLPYLSMFDSDIIDLKYSLLRTNLVKEFKLKDADINVKINFSEPIISRYFSKKVSIDNIVFNLDIDDNFISIIDKIKKIASRTNKLYFVCENNILYIESGDRSTPHINNVKIELLKDIKSTFVIEFIFKNIQSLLSILSANKKYKLLILSKTNKAGILRVYSDDDSEDYSLGSQTL